jgi:hypothetical protein
MCSLWLRWQYHLLAHCLSELSNAGIGMSPTEPSNTYVAEDTIPNNVLEESRWLAPAYVQCAGHVHTEVDREAACDVGAEPNKVVREDAGPEDAGPADAPLPAAPTLALSRAIAPPASLPAMTRPADAGCGDKGNDPS